MVGGWSVVVEPVVPVTEIEKGLSEAEDLPSLTWITMFGNLPTFVGMPDSMPVELEKDAHEGRLSTEKRSRWRVLSLVLGANA